MLLITKLQPKHVHGYDRSIYATASNKSMVSNALECLRQRRVATQGFDTRLQSIAEVLQMSG
jgi:hypothetical protein